MNLHYWYGYNGLKPGEIRLTRPGFAEDEFFRPYFFETTPYSRVHVHYGLNNLGNFCIFPDHDDDWELWRDSPVEKSVEKSKVKRALYAICPANDDKYIMPEVSLGFCKDWDEARIRFGGPSNYGTRFIRLLWSEMEFDQ